MDTAKTVALIKALGGSGGGGGGGDGIVVVHGIINSTDFYNAVNNGDQEYIIYPDKTYAEMNEADVLIACLRFDDTGSTEDVCFYSTGAPVSIGKKTFLETGIFGRETLLNMAGVDDLEFYLRVDKDNNNQPILVLLCLKAGDFDTFIVTLTPTAQDYSGTMDKTVAEIQTAYDAGKEIVFRTMISTTAYVDAPMSFASELGYAFMDFGGTIIMPSQNVMIAAETLATDDGTKQTYRATVYPLTPMS